jgi:tRNA(Ile2) C34 agmatinyltransferase TiaS
MFSSIEPECEICNRKFNRTTRIPYITIGKNVTCDHSTCRECLTKQKSNQQVEYRCPQCGDEIQYEEINLPLLKYFNIKDTDNDNNQLLSVQSSMSLCKMNGRVIENARVTGHYDHWINGTIKMVFNEFSLKCGEVFGRGKDLIDKFVVTGSYESNGNVIFVKKYVNEKQIEYKGIIDKIERNSFEIRGTWRNGVENWGSFELNGFY